MDIENKKNHENEDIREKIDFEDPETRQQLESLKEDINNMKDSIEKADELQENKDELLELFWEIIDAIEKKDQKELFRSLEELTKKENIELSSNIDNFSQGLESLKKTVKAKTPYEMSEEEIAQSAEKWRKQAYEEIENDVKKLSKKWGIVWRIMGKALRK